MENGDVLSLYKGKIKKDIPVQAGDIYVDGSRIGEIGVAVMKERKIMSSDGIVVITFNVNTKNNTLIGDVNITTRGFVQIQDNIEFLKQIEKVSKKIILGSLEKKSTYVDIKNNLINQLCDFISNKTGRYPVIMPIMININ